MYTSLLVYPLFWWICCIVRVISLANWPSYIMWFETRYCSMFAIFIEGSVVVLVS